MTTIAFEDGLHRLRISGACTAVDATAVRDAAEGAGPDSPHLTIDLTGVADMAPEVAADLVAAVSGREARGCRVTIVRKCDGEVDRLLRELNR
jgi:hypothetical protein